MNRLGLIERERERKMNICCFPFYVVCLYHLFFYRLVTPFNSIPFCFCFHCFQIIFFLSLFCLTLHPLLIPSHMIRPGYQPFSDSFHVYFHSHLSLFILLLHLVRHFLYSIFTSMFAVNTCLSRLAKRNHYTH